MAGTSGQVEANAPVWVDDRRAAGSLGETTASWTSEAGVGNPHAMVSGDASGSRRLLGTVAFGLTHPGRVDVHAEAGNGRSVLQNTGVLADSHAEPHTLDLQHHRLRPRSEVRRFVAPEELLGVHRLDAAMTDGKNRQVTAVPVTGSRRRSDKGHQRRFGAGIYQRLESQIVWVNGIGSHVVPGQRKLWEEHNLGGKSPKKIDMAGNSGLEVTDTRDGLCNPEAQLPRHG